MGSSEKRWRKHAVPELWDSLRLLSTKQWEVFDRAVGELELDPSDLRWDPIHYDNGEREIDYQGIWIRYKLKRDTRDLILLKVVPVAELW
jgi:hypothetical protein